MGATKTTPRTKTSQPAPQKHQSWVKHHTKRNVTITILVVSALIAIIVIASLPHTTVQVGQQAPDFKLQDVNGNGMFHLNDQRGRPIFIEFMRTTCEWCQKEAPILGQLFGNYSNVIFVSISIDPAGDQPSVLQAYATQYVSTGSQTHPWYWLREDAGHDLSSRYGVNGTPTMFMLDPNGIVQARIDGYKDKQPLQEAFQTIA